MSRFHVGQRVRIKFSIEWQEISGQDGVIERHFIDDRWDVAPASWGSSRAPRLSGRGCLIFSPQESQLEPLYDGNTLVSWEEMNEIWQPNRDEVA